VWGERGGGAGIGKITGETGTGKFYTPHPNINPWEKRVKRIWSHTSQKQALQPIISILAIRYQSVLLTLPYTCPRAYDASAI